MENNTIHFSGREISASLTVKDLRKSLEWYTGVMDFSIGQQYEREGNLFAVSLKAGDVRILLTQDNGAKGPDRVKGEGFSLQITTEQSIDDLANGIKTRGGELVSEPATTPWGIRMFRLKDPDGFMFVIASVSAVG